MTAPASTAVIRQWARDNGLTVGDRGRLSPELLSAYASSGTSKPKTSNPQATTEDKPAPAQGRSPRRQVRAVRVSVHPTPGATGIAHKVAARSN